MRHPAIHRKLRLVFMGGVQQARLSEDMVLGQFKNRLVEIGGRREPRLVETFANWRDDPMSILRFTRKYGPLNTPAEPGGEFSFTLKDFRTFQDIFRTTWRDLETQAHHPIDIVAMFGGTFRVSRGIITYVAPDLQAYLSVDLIANPDIERFRVCQREDCLHPYFLAGHLRQQFCSDECAEEGQRELKREWWQKHGESWRAKRRKRPRPAAIAPGSSLVN
jgi:hypothetical protein